MQEITNKIEIGEVVEGKVIDSTRNSVFIDLSPLGTGIIYGREYLMARSVLKNITKGSPLSAKVIKKENDEGYVVLSLKEARMSTIWSQALEHMDNKTIITVYPKEANRGGLIANWNDLDGFIPASQLSTENYPRVETGNKDDVQTELKKFIGNPIKVSIIKADQEENKLIFSEKSLSEREAQENMNQVIEEQEEKEYKVGDKVKGVVTGIVNFGVFVKINGTKEGLVHLSELDWGFIDDPNKFVKTGDIVDLQIIDIKDENKYSFSIKALKENPWESAADRYNVGDVVSGVVMRHNEHGILVSIQSGISGLIHNSSVNEDTDMQNKYQIGKSYDFIIQNFEPEKQKLVMVPNN